jgi:outer membrane protein assembly factor BamD (BamD/ComL family)
VCRAQLADGRPTEALQGVTNLLALAAASGQRALQAESAAFEAGILEQLNRLDEAIAAYEKNLAEDLPAARRRQALLQIIGLTQAQNRTAETALRLEKFLSQYPDDAASDVALLALGELRLKAHVAAMETNRADTAVAVLPAATNLLQQAAALFDALAKKFPQSPLLGKALLNQGWCFWLDGRISESRGAFEAAVQRLPFSADQAIARFKLADAQLQLWDFAGATTNYLAVVENFASVPEVKTNLFESALYQTVRAALEAGDMASATNAVGRILAWYPTSFLAGRSALLAGQGLGQRGDSRTARQILSDYLKQWPDSSNRPEVELAIARTHEQENNWADAVGQYDAWVARFTNHPARPQAEYNRALANYWAGRETNALALFTNLAAQFPTNELAPLAQYWVADYFSRHDDPRSAEENYQLLFQRWPASDLTYQARLMAGRAAVARQSYADAIRYFTNLTSDLNCPPGLKAHALFEWGDAATRLESTDTNKPLANFEEAIRIFSKLQQLYPTNDLAPLARGRMGDCYLQLAASDSTQYEVVAQAYQQVMDAANAGITARSQAEVGLAAVLDKQGSKKSEPEQTQSRQRAFEHYLNVVYEKNLRDGEKADPFWLKKAGLEAAKLAEELQMWEQLGKDDGLCDYLSKILPPLARSFEAKKLKAKAHLNSPGT